MLARVNKLNLILAGLIIMLTLLEYRFWLGSDSILKVRTLKQKISAQEKELLGLRARNQQLNLKIENLRKYPVSIEEQARYELGMVKHGEKYYQVVEPLE